MAHAYKVHANSKLCGHINGKWQQTQPLNQHVGALYPSQNITGATKNLYTPIYKYSFIFVNTKGNGNEKTAAKREVWFGFWV